MDLQTLQQRFGGEISGHQLVCAGPGHSPRDRSLAIRLSVSAPDGFMVFSHAGDDWRTCRDYVRQRLGLPQWHPGDEQNRSVPASMVERFDEAVIDQEAQPRPYTEDDLLRIGRASKIWDEAKDPRGTLAERYLASRALALPDDVAGTVLRFHSGCPWRDENTGQTIRMPALIAAFRSIDDHNITAVHRVALSREGKKLGRRMLGVVHRSAVMLQAPHDGELVIGEGVETCMAAMQLGHQPVSALGSVGAISCFPVIDGVRRLTVLGEAGDASARAVQLCGRRWLRAGRQVRVVMPDDGNSDLNDELMAKAK